MPTTVCLQRLDRGAIVLTHSQGGNFGLTAAATAPERVRAVISLEPSGAPDPAAARSSAACANVPHLFVWGDYLDQHSFWRESRPAVERWRDALRGAGCDVTWIELPALGIRGNSHALMADDNSDDIAALVLEWLRSAPADRPLALGAVPMRAVGAPMQKVPGHRPQAPRGCVRG